MLESILSLEKAKRQPISLLIFSYAHTSIAILLSLLIFPSQTSMGTLLLITVALLPLLHALLIQEAEETLAQAIKRSFLSIVRIEHGKTVEEKLRKRIKPLIREHADLVLSFFLLFLGMTFSFTTYSILLPQSLHKKVFSIQLSEIGRLGGAFGANYGFRSIFLHNLGVLLICLCLTFLYGAGIILLLAWNASLLSIAISTAGSLIEALNLLFYCLFEMLAYFLASMGGALLLIGVVRKYGKKEMRTLLSDFFFLLFLSILLLGIGAIIEGQPF